MRNRSVVFVVRNGKILVEKLCYEGRTFYSVPGGGIETNETPEQAAIRELKEECGLDGTIIRKVAEIYNNGRTEHAFEVSVLNLITTFIMAIVFAILLNEVRSKFGKKTVQTISYLPHFLSWIIVTGILHDALSTSGIINELLQKLNMIDSPINFFAHPSYFWPIVAFANVWKETGWNAIIYLATITSIDPCLYEAASIDGAGRWAKIKYITLPGIKSTIMILLLMNVGNVLNAGFEVQYLLGNGLIKSVSDTIDIYVLTWGISQNDYSLGTAAGIFKSAVSIILIIVANALAKRAGEERLF